MRNGKVVEEGEAADEIFAAPQTDYTRALIAAAFDHGDGRRRRGAGVINVSCPGLTRASRCEGLEPFLIEMAGTSPAMTRWGISGTISLNPHAIRERSRSHRPDAARRGHRFDTGPCRLFLKLESAEPERLDQGPHRRAP